MIKKVGYCECGCGKRTSVSLYDYKPNGYKKGVPKKFFKGHSTTKRKWNKKVYKQITINRRIVRLHRHLMEEKIGRKLNRNEHVHHINGNRFDNRIENLTILSASDHQHHHNPEAIKPALTCKQCKIVFYPHRKTSKKKIGLKQWKKRKFCSYECVWKSRSKTAKNR